MKYLETKIQNKSDIQVGKAKVVGIFIGGYITTYLLGLVYLALTGEKIDFQFVLDGILFFPASLPLLLMSLIYGGGGGDLIVLLIMAITGWVIFLLSLFLGLIFRKAKAYKKWLGGYCLLLLFSLLGVVYLYL